MKNERGYTLIELMMVVAILGILCGIARPLYSSMLAKSYEADTKGNIGTINASLSAYYSDIEGQYQNIDLNVAFGSKYFPEGVPQRHTRPFHPDSNKVTRTPASEDTDEWVLVEGQDSLTIQVNCTHSDLSGRVWNTYRSF